MRTDEESIRPDGLDDLLDDSQSFKHRSVNPNTARINQFLDGFAFRPNRRIEHDNSKRRSLCGEWGQGRQVNR